MFLNKMRITAKIWLPALIFALALIGIGVFSATNLKSALLETRKEKVRSLVETAQSVIQHYAKLEKSGAMTREEAQNAAKETVRAMRYDDIEYFFINDAQTNMVMHAVKPSLEGRNLGQLKDSTGKAFSALMVKTAIENEKGGFVDYLWPKAGHDTPVGKISYTKLTKDWNWIVGSGLYTDDVDDAFLKQFKTFAALVGLTLVIAGGLSWLVARNLSTGINGLSKQMTSLAEGNLETDISGQDRGDEIGGMAKAVEVFKQNAIEAQDLRLQQEQTRKENEEERKHRLLQLADDLQHRMHSVIEEIGGVVGTLSTSADDMRRNAEETSKQSTSVASISEQTSANVETVAAAAEELNASSAEIGRQVEHTNQTAKDAAQEAENTNEVIQGLSGAAAKIGEVVNMIQNIAEQTNLLALNATIEAARAGEAGKGFAVVASEVKNLANQTAKATDQVSQQIATIQSETDRAVNAIQGISRTINNVHDASSAIAAAVEEQHAAIQEISRNVQEASRGTQEISSHITSVSEDANLTMASANNVKVSSDALLASSKNLNATMETQLQEMRNKANESSN